MTLTEAGKRARAASPWNRGAHCLTWAAMRSYRDYVARGNKETTPRVAPSFVEPPSASMARRAGSD